MSQPIPLKEQEMEITIYEGCRGTGKSTLAFKARQKIPETTLINFTGFHADHEEGLDIVTDYYHSWMSLFFKLYNHSSKYVFDRFFFTERVFSKLYKNYNFTDTYKELASQLQDLADFGVKINIIYLTINDKEELQKRLTRDKVPFGKVQESVEESLKQQELYNHVFDDLRYNYESKNLNIYRIDTSGKTNDEVYNEVVEQLRASH